MVPAPASSGPGTLTYTADGLRLEQVLMNLLDNACKFSPEHAPVEVTLHETHGGVTLAVRDHGIGIPVEHRERVFERAFQIGLAPEGETPLPSQLSSRPGMGLGLFISRQIVELHHGTIAAESASGGGTRFVVNLPILAPGPAAAP